MTAELSDLDAECAAFRVYARRLYERPGLTRRLLVLQDEFGADINLILFCCYQAVVRGHALDKATLEHLIGAVTHWRKTAISPMRTIRRRIKQSLLSNPSLSTVYEALLVAEIEAEHVQQDMLVRYKRDMGTSDVNMPATGNEKMEVVRSVLLGYFGLIQSACGRKCIESAQYIAREAVFCTE